MTNQVLKYVLYAVVVIIYLMTSTTYAFSLVSSPSTEMLMAGVALLLLNFFGLIYLGGRTIEWIGKRLGRLG